MLSPYRLLAPVALVCATLAGCSFSLMEHKIDYRSAVTNRAPSAGDGIPFARSVRYFSLSTIRLLALLHRVLRWREDVGISYTFIFRVPRRPPCRRIIETIS